MTTWGNSILSVTFQADMSMMMLCLMHLHVLPAGCHRIAHDSSSICADRRQLLRIGAAGVVGSTLAVSKTTAAQSGLGPGRAKSVLLVLLSGGPSQLDMFDPKPGAPAEIRGEFSAINTAVPGIDVCEHLPLLASQMGRWSIVRSLAHLEHNHLLATHVALTGRPTPVPRGGSDLDRVESRNDFPNFAGALDAIQPRSDGVPTGVSLPNYYIEGPLTWPGQHAGFLGPKHDPWQINHDPNDASFRIDSLTLQPGVTSPRLLSRRRLLDEINGTPASSGSTGRINSVGEQQDLAFSLLTSDRVAKAFDIQNEDTGVRDRYGRNTFGQSLLLSRRLIEAGVPIVQAAMGIVQTWDTHVDNWGRLKNVLLPQLDLGLAALMDDLSSSGLLDQTLVIVMGEFGRTPKGVVPSRRNTCPAAITGRTPIQGYLPGQEFEEVRSSARQTRLRRILSRARGPRRMSARRSSALWASATTRC